MISLRTYLKRKYPHYQTSGSIYPGFMDMTYFAFHPASFASHKLKVALVFNYRTFP